MRADNIAFAADTEELALHGIPIVLRIDRLGKNLIQRRLQSLAGRLPVDRGILVAIRNPEIGHRGRADLSPHFRGDATAGLAMFDPEGTHLRVGA